MHVRCTFSNTFLLIRLIEQGWKHKALGHKTETCGIIQFLQTSWMGCFLKYLGFGLWLIFQAIGRIYFPNSPFPGLLYQPKCVKRRKWSVFFSFFLFFQVPFPKVQTERWGLGPLVSCVRGPAGGESLWMAVLGGFLCKTLHIYSPINPTPLGQEASEVCGAR